MDTLDQWVTNPVTEVKKPLSFSDEHIEDLYADSHGNLMDEIYDTQIKAFLAEEKSEKEAHKEYTKRNYIRVGE